MKIGKNRIFLVINSRNDFRLRKQEEADDVDVQLGINSDITILYQTGANNWNGA